MRMPLLAVALVLALCAAPPPAAAAPDGDGVKVLAAFLDYAFKNGNDLRVEARFVGRMLDTVVNTKAVLEYGDPGLLRVDLERAEGRITAVLDVNAGTGFYHIPDAGTVVDFAAREKPAAVEPGGLRRVLFDWMTAHPLKTAQEKGAPALQVTRGDGSPVGALLFTAGYKSVLRYIGYRPDGAVAFFVSFRDAGFGAVDRARFARPAGMRAARLPEEAETPFDHLAAFGR